MPDPWPTRRLTEGQRREKTRRAGEGGQICPDLMVVAYQVVEVASALTKLGPSKENFVCWLRLEA